MRKTFLFIISALIFISVFAQYDSLWTKPYGASGYETCYSVIETSDSCYLLAGDTYSFGAGSDAYYLIKMNFNGDTLWTKEYGGASHECCNDHIETSDSCYLLAGETGSYGAGGFDFWIVKTDTDGDTLWTKTYGGADTEFCFSVIETSDSCYLMAGKTESYGAGNSDFWLVKINMNGDTLWTKAYGGTSDDLCFSLTETSDSCYLMAGYTYSYGVGGIDFWLVKTDTNGDTLWTKTYGGAIDEFCYSLIETSDSCYLMAGATNSFGAGNYDYWLVKTDTNGDTLWTKSFGGTGTDYCNSLMETSDGCYLMGGTTNSFGAGDNDFWIIKTDTNGDTLRTETFGGTNSEICNSLAETSDSCYLMAGYTKSYGEGNSDYWLVKTGNVKVDNFYIWNQNHYYISTDSIDLFWHSAYCKAPLHYEISMNNVLDTISDPDTACVCEILPEGQYIWYVTAFNDYGIRTVSDNIDTFWKDMTPPAVIAVEEIPDTDYAGPYELRILAEDTLAGIDSIAINYLLPGDSIWGRTLTTDKWWSWYTGYIPQVAQSGYAYYYLDLYDRAVPANNTREPAYPDVYSFRITGLAGLSDSPVMDYTLKINQINSASINLALPKESAVNMALYDINGRVVLKNAMNLPKGNHTMNFDITPGVYFVKVNTTYGSAEQKIVNIK